MSKIVFNTHTFNNGVLTVKFELLDTFAEAGVILEDVEFSEFDCEDGEFKEMETGAVVADSDSSLYRVITSDDSDNHLIRAKVIINPESSNVPFTLPCCMYMEDGKWISEDYFVDTSVLEREILGSINLGCEDNCNIPKTIVNNLLKLFTVHAAVDSRSPQMKMIFCKLTGNNSNSVSHVFGTSYLHNCNCNG